MKIIIKKNEEGKPVVSFNTINEIISYETFEKIIDATYSNDEKIDFETEPELKEYEQLIENIVKMARTEDFKNAVASASKAKTDLETDEKKIEKI